MRLKTGAILRETRPETIITSACLGLARNVSAPNRERSFRDETVFIISIAQHAKPKVAGQRLLFRAQLTTASNLTVTTSGSDSNRLFSNPILLRFQIQFSGSPKSQSGGFQIVCLPFRLCQLLRFGSRFRARLKAPVERALLPNVYVADDQRRYEHHDLNKRDRAV